MNDQIVRTRTQKKNNPYSHIKYQEVSEIMEFFKRRKVKAGDFLGEVEKYRANPHIVTVTCDDGRSMGFAKIATTIDVVANGERSEILILSDGEIVGGTGFYWASARPGFMAGAIEKRYFPYGYVETTSLKVAGGGDMDEIAESSPISPWAFDMLTELLSAHGIFTLSLKKFIKDRIIDRLRAKCGELFRPDFLVSSILKGDSDVFNLPLRSLLSDEQQDYGGEPIIQILEGYITNIDLLHRSPPEEWNISLKDALISQLVGDALEEK